MDHIVKYAILFGTPDSRRGERVNIGVVAFPKDRIDVRFAELAKLTAITGQDWREYTGAYNAFANETLKNSLNEEEVLNTLRLSDGVIKPSEAGWFIANSPDAYERSIKEILRDLVVKPQTRAALKPSAVSAINSEMTKSFRKLKVLASKNETIRSKKIVRDYTVSAEEELKVDFAWRNGKLNCAATLDLRKHAGHGTAALKALSLDKASKRFGGDKKVNRIGVYAVDPAAESEFRPQIYILKDYSHKTFNWVTDDGRKRFLRYMADNMGFPLFGKNEVR